MKYNLWIKKKVAVYIGADPAKGQAPEITFEMTNPQILVDSDTGKITIIETK